MVFILPVIYIYIYIYIYILNTCFTSTIQAATRILARQLVRLRQQITNLQGSRAQIRGVATHTQVTIFPGKTLCLK